MMFKLAIAFETEFSNKNWLGQFYFGAELKLIRSKVFIKSDLNLKIMILWVIHPFDDLDHQDNEV